MRPFKFHNGQQKPMEFKVCCRKSAGKYDIYGHTATKVDCIRLENVRYRLLD